MKNRTQVVARVVGLKHPALPRASCLARPHPRHHPVRLVVQKMQLGRDLLVVHHQWHYRYEQAQADRLARP